MGEYLTVKQLAKQWSISESYIRKLIRAGKIGHTKFGGAVRISVAHAQEFVDRNTNWDEVVK